MKVLTKDQAKAWLNQPEHEGIIELRCFGPELRASWSDVHYEYYSCPFAVDYQGQLRRKKPWHWPRPDESTPVDAKVWVRDTLYQVWQRRYYFADTRVFPHGYTSWTGNEDRTPWAYIVLANPDNLDEMPPQGLEV